MRTACGWLTWNFDVQRMTTLIHDLRFGMRSLLRSPTFSLVAILTLALGIGANTAIFTVVNAVLLRPLPYAQPDQLVMVWQDMRAQGGPAREWASPGNVADWKSSGLFQGLAAVQGWQPTLTGAGDAEPLFGEQVTAEYFDVLGIRPAIGRAFSASDDVPNAARVVVLGHGLWQRRFGGDEAILGRSITLGGESHEVVGVMPATFRPAIVTAAELWRPRRLNLVSPARGAVILRVIARLPAGSTIDQTAAGARTLAADLERAHPEWNSRVGITLESLHQQVVGDIQQGLLMLSGAVGFVLLIACANVANLLLARATARSREVAVRHALGAGRGRLIRQLLTESLLLSAIGGGMGLLLGTWGVDALVSVAPEGAPRVSEIRLDGAAFAFAAVLTVLTSIIFGLLPALQTSRGEGSHGLREEARGTPAAATRRTRRGIIVLEVASALVLLVAAGLLMRTFATLRTFDLGFNPDRVLVAAVNPPRVNYASPERQIAFYDRLLERASSLPGVERAALSSIVPLGGDSDMSLLIEGKPLPKPGEPEDAAWYRIVSADYFATMGIPLTRGRNFDAREAAPAVIVSEASARRFWGDADPLGRRLRFSAAADEPWFTVVGVAGEVLMRGARGESRSEIYLPYWQFPELGTNIVLKTIDANPDALVAPLRQAVREIDPDVPLASVAPMTRLVQASIDQPRFLAMLVGAFAALALALAAVGIYGLIAFSVAQRTREIGVRMALGASRRDVFVLVLGEGLRMTAVGVLIGAAAALAVGASLSSLLFGVAPFDPWTFGATTLVLVLTAAIASIVPARRAASVDPMVALRAE